MNRNILTALDTIEENIRYIRQQLEADPTALRGVASFHGAQEILREHAAVIKQELPDVLRDKSVWFFYDLQHPVKVAPFAQNHFDTITEEGSTSPDVDDIYLYFARHASAAGLKGASLGFEELTPVEWVAFIDMYQTAMRDKRKQTTVIPELMVSYFTTHTDGVADDSQRTSQVVTAYAYQGLLTDDLELNKFFDTVLDYMNATRLMDGVTLDGFMVTCPELAPYQQWVVHTGGFDKLLGTTSTTEASIELPAPIDGACLVKNKPTAVIMRAKEIIDAVHYSGDFDQWCFTINQAYHRATPHLSDDDVTIGYAFLTDELRDKLKEVSTEIVEVSFANGPLEVLATHVTASPVATTAVIERDGTVFATLLLRDQDVEGWIAQIQDVLVSEGKEWFSPSDVKFMHLTEELKGTLAERGFTQAKPTK